MREWGSVHQGSKERRAELMKATINCVAGNMPHSVAGLLSMVRVVSERRVVRPADTWDWKRLQLPSI